MSAVESQSVSKRGRTDDAFSRRASHASISTLDGISGWGAVNGYGKYFRMSVWDDFIRRLEQDLAECRSDLELLESGRMQNRERRDGGAWVDTTQRELDWHKKTIGMYEGLVRKLRAEHGGEDL